MNTHMHRLHICRPVTSDLWTFTFHTGHEFPFSIKMSHIRDGGGSGGGLGAGRDPASPTDCPGVLLLDQCLPPDTQCQFILKPSKVVPGQAPLIGKTAAQSDRFYKVTWLHFETFSRTQGSKLILELEVTLCAGDFEPFKPRKSAVCSSKLLVDFLW